MFVVAYDIAGVFATTESAGPPLPCGRCASACSSTRASSFKDIPHIFANVGDAKVLIQGVSGAFTYLELTYLVHPLPYVATASFSITKCQDHHPDPTNILMLCLGRLTGWPGFAS